MSYLFLLLAIVCEVGWATSMKLSDGLTRPRFAAIMLAFYLLSLLFLTLATRTLDLSLAYAIWVGSGTAIIAIIGIVYFGEPATMIKMTSLALVVAGVIGLRLSETI